MGRRKGESYRKENLKAKKRATCPNWSLGEDTLELVKNSSIELNVCQSRLVEIAIKNLLINSNKNLINPQIIFTKS